MQTLVFENILLQMCHLKYGTRCKSSCPRAHVGYQNERGEVPSQMIANVFTFSGIKETIPKELIF